MRGSFGGIRGNNDRPRHIYNASPKKIINKQRELTKPEKDGIVEYIPNFLTNPTELYNKFSKECNFEVRHVYRDDNDDGYRLNRATCIFGDENILDAPPRIWGSDNPINPWSTDLLDIKNKIQNYTQKYYNISLGNLYDCGKRTIGWHSDREEKGSTSSIASISLGAVRPFLLKNISTGEVFEYKLENGSLFLMKEGCQENYLHCLPPVPTLNEGRINFTFRLFNKDRYGNI